MLTLLLIVKHQLTNTGSCNATDKHLNIYDRTCLLKLNACASIKNMLHISFVQQIVQNVVLIIRT